MEKQILEATFAKGQGWVFFNPSTSQIVEVKDVGYDFDLMAYVLSQKTENAMLDSLRD